MGELGLGGKRHGVGVERCGLRTPSAGGYGCVFIFKPGFSVVEIPQFHRTSRTVTDMLLSACGELVGGGPSLTVMPPSPPPRVNTREKEVNWGGGQGIMLGPGGGQAEGLADAFVPPVQDFLILLI